MLDKYAAQFNMGYDASIGEYCNMIEKGILDPLKVVSRRLVNPSCTQRLTRAHSHCAGPNRAHGRVRRGIAVDDVGMLRR